MRRKRNLIQPAPPQAHLLRFTAHEERCIRMAMVKSKLFFMHYGKNYQSGTADTPQFNQEIIDNNKEYDNGKENSDKKPTEKQAVG